MFPNIRNFFYTLLSSQHSHFSVLLVTLWVFILIVKHFYLRHGTYLLWVAYTHILCLCVIMIICMILLTHLCTDHTHQAVPTTRPLSWVRRGLTTYSVNKSHYFTSPLSRHCPLCINRSPGILHRSFHAICHLFPDTISHTILRLRYCCSATQRSPSNTANMGT